MKANKQGLFLCAGLFLAIVTGCKEDNPDPEISVAEPAVLFTSGGGSREIIVKSVNLTEEGWQPSSDADWCATEKDGDILAIKVEPNISTAIRSALVTLSGGGALFPVTIDVRQEAGEARTFRVDNLETYSIDSEGGKVVVPVFSNVEWTVVSDAGWIACEKDAESSRILLTASANTSENALEATVTVAPVDETVAEPVTLTVRQGTRAENPYYKWLGHYDIKASTIMKQNAETGELDVPAELWFHAHSTNGYVYQEAPGECYGTSYETTYTTTYCDILEDEYNTSLLLKNFLGAGMVLKLAYDKNTNTVTLPAGWMVAESAWEAIYLCCTVVSYTYTASQSKYTTYRAGYNSVELNCSISEDASVVTMAGLPDLSADGCVTGLGLWGMGESGSMYPYPKTYLPMGPEIYLVRNDSQE
ncbi:MAG: BACON domain-containing protein [Bacteroidales bacterium]|nr:BACON domain-containing protein [Bacteroidales bacterium]